jgi:predicted dinucleotide-binding enzyme
MTTVGFIGSGQIGSALARLAIEGTPYGPYSNEKGQPAGEDAIRAALATATR